MSKIPQLVIRLIDRKPSDFIMEGTENTPNPIALNSPYGRRILSNSVIKTEDGSYAPIRYIKGCDIIDKNEQDRKNIKPNPVEDKIWFEAGTLIVHDKGRDRGLYAYLKACEFNADAPGRPESADPIFEEIKAEVNAQERIAGTLKIAEAFKLVEGLAKQNADKSWTFDTERIEYMSTLFGFIGLASDEEKVDAIMALVQSRPEFFLQTITAKTGKLKAEVQKAVHLNVISLSGDKASFVASRFPFMEFKAKAKDVSKRIDEVVAHMISVNGTQDYADMLAQTETAANAQLALQE